jgi:phosphoribosyl-ATP pyrophosphohydrolase
LEQILAGRKDADPSSSYTASLYAKGTKRIAQKVGEEGVEVALAAMAKDREELINESADLLYHLTVLLQNEGLKLADVVNCLKERHK